MTDVPETPVSEEEIVDGMIPATLAEEGAKSFILQICPEKKLGKDDLCKLSSWETAKSRDKRKDRSRRKSSL